MSWKAKTVFYHQMAVLSKTGIPISEAVALAARTSPQPYKTWGPQLQAEIHQGGNLADALRKRGEKPLVAALIQSGETSSKLVDLCKEIVDFYQLAIDMRRMVIARSIYPLMLVHVLLFLPMVVLAIIGLTPFWAIPLPIFFLWCGLGGLYLGYRLFRATPLPSHVALLPFLQYLSMPLIVANTCQVLHGGLAGGMLVDQALRLAAGSCGNTLVEAELLRQADAVERQETPDLTTALVNVRLPETYTSLIQSGETAGGLEEALQKCGAVARESFRSRVQWTTRVFMGIIYGTVIAIIAIAILIAIVSYVAFIKELTNQI